MEKVEFGLVWRSTSYCYREIENFIECSDSISNEDGLRDRYVGFLRALVGKDIKKSTKVELDVLALFIDDLDNRAQIDYIEDHWEDDPDVTAGGKRFYERCQKLRAIHPTIEAA